MGFIIGLLILLPLILIDISCIMMSGMITKELWEEEKDPEEDE